jgi:hypothetical protein
LQLYEDLGRLYGREDWERLTILPEWAGKLQDLEDAFTCAWQAGGDPEGELKALAEHWAAGLAAIRTEAAA